MEPRAPGRNGPSACLGRGRVRLFVTRWHPTAIAAVMFFNRQMIRGATSMSQATRLAGRQSARTYATAPGQGNALMERAQQIGTSVAKAAERALGSYAEPIMYNLRVAGSLAKQVYISEKLAPPTSFQTWVSAYRQIFQNLSSASWWTHTLPAGQWRRVAVYGVEAVGIFTIGEMVRIFANPDRQAQDRRLQGQHARQGGPPPLM